MLTSLMLSRYIDFYAKETHHVWLVIPGSIEISLLFGPTIATPKVILAIPNLDSVSNIVCLERN